MSSLPDGWIETSLGDVVDYGKTEKIEPKDISANAWILELEDIEKDTSRLLQRLKFEQRESKSTKNAFQKGDVLYGKLRPYLNKILIADDDGFCTTEIIPIKSNIAIDGKYLFYWLKNPKFLNYVNSVSYGLNMPRLGTKDGLAAPLILAPLNEQKRIAEKLDRLLERVDACRAHLDRIPPLLKRFRQSVLAAATSGRLTADWRGSSHSSAKSWQNLLIGDLLIAKPRNGYSPKSVEFETEMKSLTLTATTSGKFDPQHFKYVNEIIPQDSHLWLEPEDILIQRANTLEYVGVSAIYTGSSKDFIYPDLMMKCRANSRISTKFLYYLLSSNNVRSYFRNHATGTAGNMPKINQQTVISVPVLVPPLEEQAEIVRRVESLFAYGDRLEARYQAARAQVEKLTPSLLAQAFRGELVPQDPNDEPASVLLERIRATRAATAKPQRAKRR